jgi:hypothetical protein
MSYPDQNGFSNNEDDGEAEATLRLIASLPAPKGLEDRVHAALHEAPHRARVLAWPVSLSSEWLRAAAAAAIVFVVAGGGWGIYAHVQPGAAVQGIAAPGPHLSAPGGFSEGGAVRRPQTLVGPTVTAAPETATPKPKAPAKTGPITASSAKTAAKIAAQPPKPAIP